MTERPSPAGRSWPTSTRLMRVHVAMYRATGGRFGHHVPGLPPMLLDHVGAKSGQGRTTPLAYMPYDASFIVAGANFGQPRNPGSTTCGAPSSHDPDLPARATRL